MFINGMSDLLAQRLADPSRRDNKLTGGFALYTEGGRLWREIHYGDACICGLEKPAIASSERAGQSAWFTLAASGFQQMLSDCLGWDCAVRPDCPSPYVCKNGDLNNGSGTAVWTYAGILKCNVPVVVVVNSPLPSPYQGGNDIIGLVENAYNGAAVPGKGKACP
jgi:hypothetical protein